MFATNSAITTVATNLGSTIQTALGGGMVVNPDGTTATAPSYTLGGNTYNDVGSALAALGNGAAGPVQYSNSGTPTTPNGGTPTNNVTLVGAAPGAVTLDNLAAGSTAGGSTQAVNGGQLNTGLSSVATNLGGGSGYDSKTGTVTAPSINVGGTAYSNVTSAIEAAGAGFNLTTGKTGTGVANGTTVEGIAAGETATVMAGDNIITTQSGNTIAVALNPALTGITSLALTGGASLDSTGINMNGDKITGLAAGAIAAASQEAVNGGQIFANQTSVATMLGGGSAVNPDGTISTPTYNVDGSPYSNVGAAIAALDKAGSAAIDTNNTSALANPTATGTDATAISGAVASGADSLAAGKNALASGGQSVAMGPDAKASGTGATALGNGAQATADSSTAVGDNAQATAADATALGQNTLASGSKSTATGYGSTAVGAGSLASGNGATATGVSSTALGEGATASNTGDVALGAGSVTAAPNKGVYTLNGGTAAATTPTSVVSVGAPGFERQIQNVAAGVVSPTSTDAINGSQLFTVATAVNTLGASTASAIGGGADSQSRWDHGDTSGNRCRHDHV
ncbi:MAG: hypothetical protein HOP09_08080 [Hyphomicrobium sp.]|nr:hypothetical protein [Hyphomicrobium sp.]